LPRRLSTLNGAELSQAVAPLNDGISPSMGSPSDFESPFIIMRGSDIELLMAMVFFVRRLV